MSKLKSRRGERVSSPRRVQAQVRAIEAIELRIAGARFAEIAEATGYNSPQACQKAVMETLARWAQETSQELINLERARLDALFMAVFPQARRGIMPAVDRCLAIMQRRARLLGLDMPLKLEADWRKEVLGQGGDDTALFEELVAEVLQRTAGKTTKSPDAG